MKYFVILVIVLISFFGLFFYQFLKFNDGKLHVVVCDVGQGDAIFIRTPKGSDILVDGGPDDSVLYCLSKHMPFWDRDLELVILTHPHADHLAGLIDVVKRYRILSFNTEKVGNTTAVYKELVRVLAEHSIKERYLWQGDRFLFKDGVELKTLWPTQDWLSQNLVNDSNFDVNGLSVIEFLSYENFKTLLTGDAGALVIEQIDSLAGKIDVLKVPHHGSKTGLNPEILSILNPKLAIISVGKNNRYGHPNQFTLDLLKSSNIKTLRTDQSGEVEIISDGKSWQTR